MGVLGIAVAIAVLTDRGLWLPGHNPYERAGALGCALLLALVVLPPVTADSRPRLLVRLLTARVVVLAGPCSYSTFLWHEPLVRLLRSRDLTFSGRPGLLLNLVVVAALTAAVSAATYKWVEQPALRRKRRSAAARTAAGRRPA